VIRTIGHGTRPVDELIALLRAHDTAQLVDVRTIPRSRRNPQFGRERLAASLATAGIAYVLMPGLGGLRKARASSVNLGWRNAAFRGYADYMETAEFALSLEALVELARRQPTAIMCAETVPWRCHRSMIADALTARGIAVLHILTAKRAEPHALTSFAAVEGTRVAYPAAAPAGRVEPSRR
jgi:uncharacterized protein (DUF488 family)